MRVLVVGATGMLGRAVSSQLEQRGHTVLPASRTSSVHLDLRAPASIQAALERLDHLDAVMCTAGVTPFASLEALTRDDVEEGIADKLLGQIDLVLRTLRLHPECHSLTLVSGYTADSVVPTGSVASTVNAGINAFTRSAALSLQPPRRLNVVSSTVFQEAWPDLATYFPGARPVAVREVAAAFLRSLEGSDNGCVISVS